MSLALIILFAVLLIMGVPIAICLGLSSMLALIFFSDLPLMIVSQMVYASVDSFSLMAIPFFMLAGSLMNAGGLSKRLIHFANTMIGPIAGGLGLIVVVTSMFFAAISGSGPATVGALGAILIPGMINLGYSKEYSSALQATAGSIGIIIPPSIPMIIYGVQAEVSVAMMFLAGMIPGLLYGVCLMIYNYAVSKKRNYRGAEKTNISEKIASFKEAFFALIMPLIILGGIYGGIFTPTEASAVAAVYGLIIGSFIYKELKLKDIPQVLIEAAIGSAVVLLIIMGASIFSFIVVSQGVPGKIVSFIDGITQSKILILLLINVFLLIVGCFLDASSAIIVLTPLLLPLTNAIGVHPVHFGIIMVINLAIGLITPPVGLDLYVACSISKISLESISRAVIPMIVVCIVSLLLVTFIPSISLFLPALLGFK